MPRAARRIAGPHAQRNVAAELPKILVTVAARIGEAASIGDGSDTGSAHPLVPRFDPDVSTSSTERREDVGAAICEYFSEATPAAAPETHCLRLEVGVPKSDDVVNVALPTNFRCNGSATIAVGRLATGAGENNCPKG